MASHAVAIARASLTACLIRSDPGPVSMTDQRAFHELLNRSIVHCSTHNIQPCKEWILQHVIQSSERVVALSNYLIAVAVSKDTVKKAQFASCTPSVLEQRTPLHILYLIGDIAHHLKYHLKQDPTRLTALESLQPYMRSLVLQAAEYWMEGSTVSFAQRSSQCLLNLLGLWRRSDLIDAVASTALTRDISKMQQNTAIRERRDSSMDALPKLASVAYILPETHGDMLCPSYDLPAGNLLPHMQSKPGSPIPHQSLVPIRLSPGLVLPNLASAVKHLVIEAELLGTFGDPELDPHVNDIDALGRLSLRDSRTIECRPKSSYYGWSEAFCRQLRQGKGSVGKGQSLQESMSMDTTGHASRNNFAKHAY